MGKTVIYMIRGYLLPHRHLVATASALMGLLLARPANAATFVVDRTDDSAAASACTAAANDCSLRGAIISANAVLGTDTVSIPAGVYTLTLTGRDEEAAATGDLDVTQAIVITGASASSVVIDGNGKVTGQRGIFAMFRNSALALNADAGRQININ